MRSQRFLIGLTSLAALLSGCSDAPLSEPSAPVRKAESGAGDNDASADSKPVVAPAERKDYDGLGFIVPPKWEEVPLSDFQRGIITARFRLPHAGPETTVTLSRASGGVQSNLDRWRGQFRHTRPERVETLKIDGKEATLADFEGEFSPGFGKETHGTWRMIGVIIPMQPQDYFIKLTGPVDEVSKIEDEFMKFVRSAAVAR